MSTPAPAAPAEEVLDDGKVRDFCGVLPRFFLVNFFSVMTWCQVDPAYQLPPGLPPGSKVVGFRRKPSKDGPEAERVAPRS